MDHDRQRITLRKPWGRHEAGAILTVLAPGDEITPATVDQARAATLLRDGFAELPPAPAAAPEEPIAAEQPPRAPRRARKEA